jgi:tRNA G18 (ribose-2'-O)-methylase SpoU
MGAVDVVPWQRFDNALAAIRHLKERNVPVWAAETTTASKPYNRVRYPRELAIVLGNEALGVNSEALRLCEEIIEIPTFGFKNSMNVASAAAVLGYKALEMMQSESGDVEKRC